MEIAAPGTVLSGVGEAVVVCEGGRDGVLEGLEEFGEGAAGAGGRAGRCQVDREGGQVGGREAGERGQQVLLKSMQDRIRNATATAVEHLRNYKVHQLNRVWAEMQMRRAMYDIEASDCFDMG